MCIVCVCSEAYVLVFVEGREGHWVSSAISLHLSPSRRGLREKLELAIFQLGRQPASPGILYCSFHPPLLPDLAF